LSRYFAPDAVVGGDGPFPRKPDPSGLRHLMARTGAAARETAMVGDSPIDLRTARAAATPLYLARYGFGFDAQRSGELRPIEGVIDNVRVLSAV